MKELFEKVGATLTVLLMLSSLVWWGAKAQSLPNPLSIRYESGVFFAQQNEGVQGAVINLDSVAHTYRVVISQFQGNPTAAIVSDSGTQIVAAGARAALGFGVPSGIADAFLVEITTDSEKVVPNVSIQPPCAAVPCVPPRFWLHGSQLTKFRQEF